MQESQERRMKIGKPEIIFEDDHLIAVNKPPYLFSIGDRFDSGIQSVRSWLLKSFDDVFLIHRLDQETSGVIVFGKHKAAHRAMSIAFEKRQVEKHYQVLVSGTIRIDGDTINKPIAESKTRKGRMIIHDKFGKPSVSHYKVLERFKGYSFLDVHIETGRTHQIRVHLAAIGHPPAIDPMYGSELPIYASQLKGKHRFSGDQYERALITRVPLHAAQLTFPHPETGELTTITAELPKDIRATLQQLRKWRTEAQ